MGVIDQMKVIEKMKYAKILCIADYLEDMLNETHIDSRCRDNIKGVVKELRKTVTSSPIEMKDDRIEIKRIDCRYRATMIGIPPNELDYMESLHCHTVEKDLLNYIRSNHLIRINKQKENDGDITFTASLIVVIDKQPYVLQEPMITPCDNILKSMDEKK